MMWLGLCVWVGGCVAQDIIAGLIDLFCHGIDFVLKSKISSIRS